jgi:hypothetical protein
MTRAIPIQWLYIVRLVTEGDFVKYPGCISLNQQRGIKYIFWKGRPR